MRLNVSPIVVSQLLARREGADLHPVAEPAETGAVRRSRTAFPGHDVERQADRRLIGGSVLSRGGHGHS